MELWETACVEKKQRFSKEFIAGKVCYIGVIGCLLYKRRTNTVRIGITTSKKSEKRSTQQDETAGQGKYQAFHDQLVPGMDLVIVVRKADSAASLHSIGREMKFLLKKLDILVKDKYNEGTVNCTD